MADDYDSDSDDDLIITTDRPIEWSGEPGGLPVKFGSHTWTVDASAVRDKSVWCVHLLPRYTLDRQKLTGDTEQVSSCPRET